MCTVYQSRARSVMAETRSSVAQEKRINGITIQSTLSNRAQIARSKITSIHPRCAEVFTNDRVKRAVRKRGPRGGERPFISKLPSTSLQFSMQRRNCHLNSVLAVISLVAHQRPPNSSVEGFRVRYRSVFNPQTVINFQEQLLFFFFNFWIFVQKSRPATVQYIKRCARDRASSDKQSLDMIS